MKKVIYLIITRELTGDSEVLFFPNVEKGVKEFQRQIAPMLEACLANNISSDEYDVSAFDARFNGCVHDDLDGAIGINSNINFELLVAEVNDNVTHYLVDFSDYVNESRIEFFPEASAKITYDITVKEILDDSRTGIDRLDKSTWEGENGELLFKENKKKTEAFFGFGDNNSFNTIRLGKITKFAQ